MQIQISWCLGREGLSLCIYRHSHSVNFLYCLALVSLYPGHTKYVGVYSFRFSVRLFVRTYLRSYVHSFVRSFVFPSQGQSFCVKVYKTSYFEDPLMDFIHIWHDGRYRSKIFISTIPTPGVTLRSRSRSRT